MHAFDQLENTFVFYTFKILTWDHIQWNENFITLASPYLKITQNENKLHDYFEHFHRNHHMLITISFIRKWTIFWWIILMCYSNITLPTATYRWVSARKKYLTSLLMHWSYVFFALTHWYALLNWVQCQASLLSNNDFSSMTKLICINQFSMTKLHLMLSPVMLSPFSWYKLERVI